MEENVKNGNLAVRRLVYSAVCLALCMVLPYITGQVPTIGNMLCPMHLPVLICGFICSWRWGLAVGFIAPLLRHFTLGNGMPPLPVAVPMAFELAAYGAVAGIMASRLPRDYRYLYLSLITAMVVGRLVWGAAKFVYLGFSASEFPFSAFISGAVTTAIPAIIIQIAIIPPIVHALRKAKLC